MVSLHKSVFDTLKHAEIKHTTPRKRSLHYRPFHTWANCAKAYLKEKLQFCKYSDEASVFLTTERIKFQLFYSDEKRFSLCLNYLLSSPPSLLLKTVFQLTCKIFKIWLQYCMRHICRLSSMKREVAHQVHQP